MLNSAARTCCRSDQVALAKQLLAEQCATDLEELESAMKLGADPHPQRVSLGTTPESAATVTKYQQYQPACGFSGKSGVGNAAGQLKLQFASCNAASVYVHRIFFCTVCLDECCKIDSGKGWIHDDTCISFLGVSLVQHIQPMMLAGYAVVTAGSPKKLHSVLQELLFGSNDSRTKGLMGEIWDMGH